MGYNISTLNRGSWKMKKFLVSLFCVFATTICFAFTPIGLATTQSMPNCTASPYPPSSPSFCDAFRTAAPCFCVAHGQSPNFCQNMQAVYNAMMALGGLSRACSLQHDTSQQDCIDSWNCYINGSGACNHKCI
jgi:hypothetical protein